MRKLQKMKSTTTFIVLSNGGALNLSVLWTELEWARKTEWTKSLWKSKPALVEINGNSSRPYVGQNFDEKHFEIKEGEWTHEHCDICTAGIYDENEVIYVSNNETICENCHQDFIIPTEINVAINKMKKVER